MIDTVCEKRRINKDTFKMNVVTNKGRNVKKERLIEFAEFHRVEASGSGQRNDYNASNDE